MTFRRWPFIPPTNTSVYGISSNLAGYFAKKGILADEWISRGIEHTHPTHPLMSIARATWMFTTGVYFNDKELVYSDATASPNETVSSLLGGPLREHLQAVKSPSHAGVRSLQSVRVHINLIRGTKRHRKRCHWQAWLFWSDGHPLTMSSITASWSCWSVRE